MLVADGLTKEYGDRVVLSNISLRVEQGEMVCIVGSFGAGKTTLIKTLASNIEASKGNLSLHGIDAQSKREEYATRVSCYQDKDALLYRNLTVFDNLVYSGYVNNLPSSQMDEQILLLSRYMGIDCCLRKKVGALTTEEKLKVVLSIMLLPNPSLILLDDPFLSITESENDILLMFMKRVVKDRNCAIVFTSSSFPSADLLQQCNSVYSLEHGKLKTTSMV